MEGFQAKLAAPFVVLAIRTSGEVLTEIAYLPRQAPTLEPLNRFAVEVCRQLSRSPGERTQRRVRRQRPAVLTAAR